MFYITVFIHNIISFRSKIASALTVKIRSAPHPGASGCPHCPASGLHTRDKCPACKGTSRHAKDKASQHAVWHGDAVAQKGAVFQKSASYFCFNHLPGEGGSVQEGLEGLHRGNFWSDLNDEMVPSWKGGKDRWRKAFPHDLMVTSARTDTELQSFTENHKLMRTSTLLWAQLVRRRSWSRSAGLEADCAIRQLWSQQAYQPAHM